MNLPTKQRLLELLGAILMLAAVIIFGWAIVKKLLIDPINEDGPETYFGSIILLISFLSMYFVVKISVLSLKEAIKDAGNDWTTKVFVIWGCLAFLILILSGSLFFAIHFSKLYRLYY